jgi:3-isopropylmalate dehydrogenase
LKESVAKGVEFIVVRELIGGLYFGDRTELVSSLKNVDSTENYAPTDAAFDTMIYSVGEVERITRVAAQIALASNPPLPIHSIDKANVLASSRLWRKVVTATIKREYPQLEQLLDHQLVDSAAMVMVANPRKLNGVILTENMFGDMYVAEYKASSPIPSLS